MHLKEQMVHFIEESSETLRLGYQATLQAIQIVSILHNYHHKRVNDIIARQPNRAKCFALALLGLCCKLHESKPVHMREFVKLVDGKYRDIAV